MIMHFKKIENKPVSQCKMLDIMAPFSDIPLSEYVKEGSAMMRLST